MYSITRLECFLTNGPDQHIVVRELAVDDNRDPLKQKDYLASNCFAFRFFDEVPNTYGKRRHSRYGSKGNYSALFGRNGQELCPKPKGENFLKAREITFKEGQRLLREKADRDRSTYSTQGKT